jgi:two-component system nitrate/nitrite response regulator NarL
MVRVAVVDDHPFIVKVMTMAIESDAGLELAGVAETAEAALADLPALAADVVLLDHHLRGDVGGAELIAALRDAGMRGRVLLFTADDAVAARALEAGADGAISKRNGPGIVCDAIRRVAAGETVLEGPDA